MLAGGAVDLQREQGEDGPGGAGRQGLLDEQEVRPRPRQRRLPQRHQQRQDRDRLTIVPGKIEVDKSPLFILFSGVHIENNCL